MWECGLKPNYTSFPLIIPCVTPYVGVWIETQPYTTNMQRWHVTPYVGVWIETLYLDYLWFPSHCHSLCGSVD